MDDKLVIDVSHWDGDINVKSWKHKRGCWAVIAKAGGDERRLGRYRDSRFEENHAKSLAAGLHVGTYYYTVCTDVETAREDADHFCDLLDGHAIDMPAYMDVEDLVQLAIGRRALTEVIVAFCTRVAERGYRPGVYTGRSAWFESVDNGPLYQYADWIASWQSFWPSQTPRGEVGMWQQGSMSLETGAVAYEDVSGYVDVDWCCVDYPAELSGGESAPDSVGEQPSAGTVERLMEVAYGELGYYAPDDPEKGSKYLRWLADWHDDEENWGWLRGWSWEAWWCCGWVSWCMHFAYVTCPGFPSQNTNDAYAAGAYRREVPKSDIRRGDILIFDWDFSNTETDHIGFATASPVDGYVATIEGNVGNAVKERVRPLSSIRYVIRPEYVDEAEGFGELTNGEDWDAPLVEDGIAGPLTIHKWQDQLGTTPDGVVSGQRRSWYWAFDGVVSVTFEESGSQLVAAVQRIIGAYVDGCWGEETSRKLQKWLVDHGYSVGPCGIDSRVGHDTVEGLQRSLNDGAWSS